MQGRLGLVTVAALALVSPAAWGQSGDMKWCKDTADTFVKAAYKRDKDGALDNGWLESRVLDDRVAESQRKGGSDVTGQLMNRALYLRSRTSTPESEAVADVYALCATLTSGGGSGRSKVSYGSDVGASFADKESAWSVYYRPAPKCENPVDWDVTVECGNEKIRARAEFDKRWARGEYARGRQ